MAQYEIPAFVPPKKQLDSSWWMRIALGELKNPIKKLQQHSGGKKRV